MDKRIEKIKQLRRFLLSRIEGLTVEQMNIVPAGFNNNIIWNVAHLVAAQQVICYVRSGVPVVVSEEYIKPYLPGTKPEGFVDEERIEKIKEVFLSSIEQMDEDYEKGLFANYTFSERIREIYGIEVRTIEDAIDFVLYHEGFHVGSVMGLRRLV